MTNDYTYCYDSDKLAPQYVTADFFLENVVHIPKPSQLPRYHHQLTNIAASHKFSVGRKRGEFRVGAAPAHC